MILGYLILGVGLLAAAVLATRWFVAAEPREVVRVLKWVALVFAALLAVFLILSGRWVWAFAALPALFPWLMRMRYFWRKAKAAMGPTPGQTSDVKTRFLHMTLDHDSGELWGRILEGEHQGRDLGDLSLDELIALWRVCQVEDPPSAEVLESWLDRNKGEDWRDAAEGGDAGGAGEGRAGGGPMTREEAFEILGLEPGADEAAIRDAHRRLLQKIHPDHGGSNYLAAKINEAKDLLLRGR